MHLLIKFNKDTEYNKLVSFTESINCMIKAWGIGNLEIHNVDDQKNRGVTTRKNQGQSREEMDRNNGTMDHHEDDEGVFIPYSPHLSEEEQEQIESLRDSEF